ncbi:MAG: glycosyltransferase family 2 protein [Verrucomicrobia bacterium]|jgi:glycosyltransferase involved in cell wall biosynthesis|nr:glycosyltransferase family 2 protein [Verrucomicrobiota bacterium]MBT7068227.1 glycosyltransferase family 2 protein [Verrucomicrobiota bacterium]MBT7699637.1 glycosyltransferase family 2 protein [Verrucomicrobiota bacterium]
MPAPTISIVIPAFNEEQHLEQTVLGVIGLLDSSVGRDSEILIFDDGSTDGTGVIAEELSQRYPFIRSFHFKQNQGLGHVARRAIKEAGKDYIMWHTGDGSVDSRSLVPAMRSIGKADIIVAYLENQNDRIWIRSALSRSFVALYNVLFHLKLRYYSGPSIFPCEVLRSLSIKSGRYEFWAEIMVRCLKLGLTHIEMPFVHNPPADNSLATVRPKNVGNALRIALILMNDLYLRKNVRG